MRSQFKKICALAAVLVGVIGLSACTPAQPGQAFNDPYEARNRSVHAFNKGLDSALLRPAGDVAMLAPQELRAPVVNFAENVALPGQIANGILQGDLRGIYRNTMRFLLNTTLGVGGLLDPADDIGLYEESTDFGETLAVWGVGEGAYIELPVLGPSNERDAVGEIVDLVFNPWSAFVTSRQSIFLTGSKAAAMVVERGQFSGLVDQILYESADSYAQARLIYLQKRRFDLGVTGGALGATCGDASADIDPYADPYADEDVACDETSSTDIYIDPYEDF